MVHRLTIAYRGTRYAGWQRQNNAETVQAVVEAALADLIGRPVTVHGAGRTDAGVHADAQVAHLGLSPDVSLTALVHGGNHRLPPDVRLLAAARMGDDFHARKSTLGKRYRYRLHLGRVVPPLAAETTVAARRDLDLEAMRTAIRLLVGRHDFTAFAAAGGSHGQPWRRLFAATLEHDGGRNVSIALVGDGFLRGMVRAIVGTALEVGRGRRSLAAFAALLEGRPREEAGPTAPAQGLVLERVFYPPSARPHDAYRA